MKKDQLIEDEKKKLVLARFNTLNPESKIMLGNGEEISVKELITHIKEGDDFGKKVIDIQIKMLKVLAGGV
ncbi:hypothetical protein HYU06_00025 [Candidatus Woesearchaeota archaeon]|nr:hypothetical protein [Candidatus Woesearchaeota archaeon]